MQILQKDGISGMTQSIFDSVAWQYFGPDANVDPVEQEDFVPSIKENQAKLHQSIEKRNNDLARFEQQKGPTGLEKLAKLAPSIIELPQVQEQIQNRNIRLDAKAQEEALRLHRENPNLLTSYNQEEARDSLAQTSNEILVDGAYARNEIDVNLADNIRTLDSIKDKRVRRQLLNLARQQMPGYMSQLATRKYEILNNDGEKIEVSLSETEDPYERTQINGHIKRAYLQPFSEAGWNQAMVYKHLGRHFDGAIEKNEQTNAGKIQQRYKEQADADTYTSIIEHFEINPENGAEGLQAYLAHIRPRFEHYDRPDAMSRMFLRDKLTEMAKGQEYDDMQGLVESLNRDKVLWRGDKEPKTFMERFPNEFNEVERILATAEGKELQETLLKQKNRGNEFVASLYKLADDKANSNDPNEDPELTNADITAAVNQFRAENPGVPVPTEINNIVTREERIDAADQEILKAVFNSRGVVHGSDTAGMSFATQRWAAKEFQGAYKPSQGGDIQSQFEGVRGSLEKQIDAQIYQHFQATAGDLKDSEEIVEAKRLMRGALERTFWTNYTDPTQGHTFDTAVTKTMKDLRESLADGNYMVEEPKQNKSIFEKRKNAYRLHDGDANSYKTTRLPHTEMDMQMLLRIQGGDKSVQIPEIYRYYASLNLNDNTDGWDVADAQLKLHEKKNGLPIVGLDKQQPLLKKYVEGLTSPLERQFLKTRPSYGRTRRVIVLQEGGDFNDPELVLDGAL